MGGVIFFLHKQNSLKDTIISQLNISISQNNETIKKLEIDLDTFKKKEPIIKEKIVEKYIKIKPKDDSCKAQLDAVDKLIEKYLDTK